MKKKIIIVTVIVLAMVIYARIRQKSDSDKNGSSSVRSSSKQDVSTLSKENADFLVGQFYQMFTPHAGGFGSEDRNKTLSLFRSYIHTRQDIFYLSTLFDNEYKSIFKKGFITMLMGYLNIPGFKDQLNDVLAQNGVEYKF